jgi:hypothetical protein
LTAAQAIRWDASSWREGRGDKTNERAPFLRYHDLAVVAVHDAEGSEDIQPRVRPMSAP